MRGRKGSYVVWPVYLDARESRQLRRVPKELAVPGPRLEELCAALDRLGLSYEVVEGAAHPARHWAKTGYLFVEKKMPKTLLLRRLGALLRRMRARGKT